MSSKPFHLCYLPVKLLVTVASYLQVNGKKQCELQSTVSLLIFILGSPLCAILMPMGYFVIPLIIGALNTDWV